MTEAEWLACHEPDRMLASLGARASDKVRRLFACTCCRRIYHLISDERSRDALEVAERFAKGYATEEELATARQQAGEAQEEARHAEWCAEARANFCYTPDYCAASARLYAACAVRAALSVEVAQPDGGWECYAPVPPDFVEIEYGKRREGSHVWAAWAVGEVTRSVVYGAREVENVALYDMAAPAACAAEAAEQAVILRRLVGNSYCQA